MTAPDVLPLVLASASPRRASLLASLGIPLEVVPAGVVESPLPGERAADHVLRLAREKAAAVAALLPGRTVLGSDTAVVVDGAVFGKPVDENDARRMLTRLQGRAHEVLTAWWIIDRLGRGEGGVERSLVTMRSLDEAAIARYLARGESLDKAGGYAAQGAGGEIIEHIEGSWSNVVGLPLPPVAARLAALGYDLPAPVSDRGAAGRLDFGDDGAAGPR